VEYLLDKCPYEGFRTEVLTVGRFIDIGRNLALLEPLLV